VRIWRTVLEIAPGIVAVLWTRREVDDSAA